MYGICVIVSGSVWRLAVRGFHEAIYPGTLPGGT